MMWAALAGMFATAGESRSAPWQQSIRSHLFILPFATGTFMLGYARDAISDWLAITVLAFLSVIAGIVCTWSKYTALTAMQVLMIGSLVTGMKNGDWWHYALSFVAGTCFYLVLYLIQAFCERKADAYSWLRSPLLKLAAKLKHPDPETDTAYVEAFADAANADLLSAHYREVLAAIDEVAVTTTDPRKCATELNNLANDLQKGQVPPSGSPELAPLRQALRDYLDSGEVGNRCRLFPASRDVIQGVQRHHGRGIFVNGLRLGSAYTVGLVLGQVLPFHHLFWVATTVAVVMTPQIGASVSRAIQRLCGTLVGVIIGTLAMVISVNHYWLAGVIALLAFFLPWACGASQIFKQFAMTPIVLLLGDLIVPGTNAPVFYGDERLLATFLGAVVVIVFGYLIWPSAREPRFGIDFQRIVLALCDYAKSSADGGGPHQTQAEQVARAGVYQQISIFQQTLQPALGEPPHTGNLAAAWIPAELAATSTCDALTAHLGNTKAANEAQAALSRLAQRKPVSAPSEGDSILDAVSTLSTRIAAADPRYFI